MLIVLVLALFVAQRWLLRGRSFTTLTGKTSRREPQELGPVRWVFTALVVVFLLLNLVLPLFAMILGSLQPIFGVMSTGLTLDNYAEMLTDPVFSSSLSLTAWLAVIGGFGSIAIALLTTYVTARRRGFIRSYTSFAVWIPWALPGIVLALAYMFAVLYVPAFRGLYGSAFLMTLVLIVATIPVSSRIAEGALAQLSPELEEAGRTSGAGSWRVLLTIVLRLIIPSFLSGWFLSALFISGNLAVPMLLAPRTPARVADRVSGVPAGQHVPGRGTVHDHPDRRDGRARHRRTLDEARRPTPERRRSPPRPPHPHHSLTHPRGRIMTFSRKTLRITTALLAAGALTALTACSSSGAASKPDKPVEVPGASAEANDYMNELYDKAVEEGKTDIVLYGPSVSAQKSLFDVFTDRFPGIKMVQQDQPDAQSITKIEAEAQSGSKIADIYDGGESPQVAAEPGICTAADVRTAPRDSRSPANSTGASPTTRCATSCSSTTPTW